MWRVIFDRGLRQFAKRFVRRDVSSTRGFADLGVADARPQAVGASKKYIASEQWSFVRDAHMRKCRITAEATFNEVTHGMSGHFVFTDDALSQKQLDVAVIARSCRYALVANLVDTTVADMRPKGPVILDQTDGGGCPRFFFENEAVTQFDDAFMCASEGQRQEALRIKNGSRNVGERFFENFERHFRCARALRVPAHAVDDGKQQAIVLGEYRDAILILRAIAQQTDLC